MSLSTLFSRKSVSNESNARSSKDMLTRGKEIVRGRIFMRKGNSSKKSLSEVVVYCAPHDCSQPGQLEIHEDVNKAYQKPKKVISLTNIMQPGVQSGSPCTSLSCSPGNYTFGTSPSSGGVPLWPFQLVLKTGEVFEFFAESAEDQRQWVKRLGLLLMFPMSPIPEEPVNSPIKESIRAKLNPMDYRADSVWAVYILPEEVGSRINALGLHVVALRSRGNDNQPGQLDIINLADPSSPVVTWDRDKMRRTGCLGNMVFIEIGRRCRGGAGLVWMYAGPKETAALRETLHAFLFKGDGRAVPISTQQLGTDLQQSKVSFDSGVPFSHPKRSSSTSLQQSPSISTPQRQHSMDSQASDSGLPPSYPPKRSSSSSSHQSPIMAMQHNHMNYNGEVSSPYSNQPPPVHLSSHPRRRQSFRTSYENVDSDSGLSSGVSSSSSGTSSFGSRRGSTLSDMTDGEQFHLEDDVTRGVEHGVESQRHPTFSTPKSGHYQVPPIRSHTVSGSAPYQHAGNYERMINPRMAQTMLLNNEEQYVQMKPAPSRTNSMRSVSDSPPRQLRPISEGRVLYEHRGEVSDYENLPFQSTVNQSDFVNYAPQYENMEQFRRHDSFLRSEKLVKSASPSGNQKNVRTVETPSPPVIIPTP